jgi:hypothetical protein
MNWGQIPIVLMFREPKGSLSVSGVYFVQRPDNCCYRGGRAVLAISHLETRTYKHETDVEKIGRASSFVY